MRCLKCLKCLNIVQLIFNITGYFTHEYDLQNKRYTGVKVKTVKAPLQSSYDEAVRHGSTFPLPACCSSSSSGTMFYLERKMNIKWSF